MGGQSMNLSVSEFGRLGSVATGLLLAIISLLFITNCYGQLGDSQQFTRRIRMEKVLEGGGLGWNGIGFRRDGSLLIVNEWGQLPKGIYGYRPGTNAEKIFQVKTGDAFTDPEDVVEVDEGLYVTNNGGLSPVILIPADGSPLEKLRLPQIRNPYCILVVPDHCVVPKLAPGDLLIFDNAFGNRLHSRIWFVDRSNFEVNAFADARQLPRTFLQGEFSPTGELFVSLNCSEEDGVYILRYDSNGKEEMLLHGFRRKETLDRKPQLLETHLAINPSTAEVYFNTTGGVFAMNPPDFEPRMVIRGQSIVHRFSPDGTHLLIQRGQDIWEMEDASP